MSEAKTKTYGFQTKTRTKAEIDQEYTKHAMQVGHNLRVISQIQEENDSRLAEMVKLNLEASKLPTEEPANTAKTEETTETKETA